MEGLVSSLQKILLPPAWGLYPMEAFKEGGSSDILQGEGAHSLTVLASPCRPAHTLTPNCCFRQPGPGAGHLPLRLTLLHSSLGRLGERILHLLAGERFSLLCFLILLACGEEGRHGGPFHGLFPSPAKSRSLIAELWPTS